MGVASIPFDYTVSNPTTGESTCDSRTGHCRKRFTVAGYNWLDTL